LRQNNIRSTWFISEIWAENFHKEIQKAFEADYIIGVSEKQFAPTDYITREQAAIIIVRILNIKGNESGADVFIDRNQISRWSKEYVGIA